MDGREHNATPPHRPQDQEPLGAEAVEHYMPETMILLTSTFEQARAGHEDAQTFFFEALRDYDATVFSFLERLGNQGDVTASLLLRGHYLSMLQAIRVGDDRVASILHRQICRRDRVAHSLLVELTVRGDQVAREVLFMSYDVLLKRFWQGKMEIQAFFNEQLCCQNDAMLMFLNERAMQDEQVSIALLYPYYRSLLPQATINEQAMIVFQKRLLQGDEVVLVFLIQQVDSGSSEAFYILWKTYQPAIEGYVRYLVGRASVRLISVEDLMQEIFMRAWQSLPHRRKKEQKMHFRAWLYKVAQNETIDHFRHIRVSLPLIEASADILTPGPEDEACERDCWNQALQRLGEQMRNCILLADVYKYSTQEIATGLGIAQSTVTSYLSRGRPILRRYYLEALSYKPGRAQLSPLDTSKQHAKKQDTDRRGENHG